MTIDGQTFSEKELFSKLMEVYAAFSTYTDEQVGKIYDYLKERPALAREHPDHLRR